MVGFAERYREEGLEKGLEQGLAAERQLLVRLIKRRFGHHVAEDSSSLLKQINDPERLADIGEWILETQDGAIFLAWLQEGR